MRSGIGCILLVVGCGLCRGQEDTKPIKTTLCNLYQHPDQFQGRLVKVRGGSVSSLWIEDILHDSPSEPCPAYLRIVVEYPDKLNPTPSFQLVRDESFRKLQEALNYGGPMRIDATYAGRFDVAFVWRDQKRINVGPGPGKGYGKKGEYDGRIVLNQVYDVWARPLPRR
jgi:hypothetical protein